MFDPSYIKRFIASMPARYAQTFDATAIAQHARTTRARGQRLVNVGLFSSPERTGKAICVVATDRPGLLAIISLAFVTCDLDIIAAEVFTRHGAGSSGEAVDLFWVRRPPFHCDVALAPADIRRIRATLTELLQRAPKELLPPGPRGPKAVAAAGTSVRFLEDLEGRFVTLEIETSDKTGLWLGVCQALFNAGIQIVGSRIKTDAGRVTGRFDIVEHSDRPIEQSRRHVIKLAVLTAVDRLPNDAISLMVG